MATRARKHTCTQCSKAYTNPDDLTGHNISQHNAPQLVCNQPGCNKAFKSPRTLKRHVKEKHEKQCFSCSYCELSCARQENLKRHESSCRNKSIAQPAAPINNAVTIFDPRAVSFSTEGSIFSSICSSPSESFNEPITPPSAPTDSFGCWWTTLRLQAINQAAILNTGMVDSELERQQMSELICNTWLQGHIDENLANILYDDLDQLYSCGLSLSECTPIF